MSGLEHTALGMAVAYEGHYDAARLQPIARALSRSALGLAEEPPFVGVDVWNAYELSWLDPRGRPRVALAEIRVPADSPNLIESKSLKLYLNGFMQTTMDDAEAVREQVQRDLSQACGDAVAVALTAPTSPQAQMIEKLDGELIDDLPISVSHYGPPRAEFLSADEETEVNETLVSHLLKSNCPVTGQPDWASVQIAYAGPRLDRAGLLRYLVSFREHAEFHEACVERIFCDLQARARPQRLSVYARYTRRGGIDINPFRATPGTPLPGNPRVARQ